MIELPQQFKNAIGSGSRTSLYPLIRIYKGVRIGDDLSSATEIINLSSKDISIKNNDNIYEQYLPLLLSSPSISSKADIVNNKYTISSVSLKISNAQYHGEIFSDKIPSYLNSVTEIYYSSNGIHSLSDCLLVYTGTIRRYNQSQESVSLTLEDLTQQMLSAEIPSSKIPDEEYYKEEDIGRPIPMVYGYNDKSPVIPKSTGLNEFGELEEELTNFIIDKNGRKVGGLWETPSNEQYGNDYLNANHPLVLDGYLKAVGTLSMYKDNFIPIPQKLNVTGWSFYVGGITDSSDSAYHKIDGSDLPENLYQFEQSVGDEHSANVKLNAEAMINQEGVVGLPTRIYRPLTKIECYTFCDNDNGSDPDAIDRIYGFANYEIGVGSSRWVPWGFGGNVTSNDYYIWDWDTSDPEATFQMWQPTVCNLNWNGGVHGSTDNNWKNNYGGAGFFPIERLQNGRTEDGIYVCCRNPDGKRGAQNKTGKAFVKMVLSEDLGSFPCSTKFVFDSEYHSFDGMEGASNSKKCYPAAFWQGESTPIFDADNHYVGNTASDMKNNSEGFPYIPTKNGWEHVSYSGQSGTQDSVKGIGVLEESTTFNNTDTFDSIKFGIMEYDKYGSSQGNDKGYVACQLFNFYVLHDAVIDSPLDKDFYADVVGRLNEDGTIIRTAQEIFKDILRDELGYQGDIQGYEEHNPWLYSFSLFESTETKKVFEDLFKSSTLIPSFNSKGEFKIIPIHQKEIEDWEEYQENGTQAINSNSIDVGSIINYSFELTNLDDVKNQVNIIYKKNYAANEYTKETGYYIGDTEYDTYDKLSQSIYPDNPELQYSINYYGLTDVEARLDFESDYIRDDDMAKKLQKRLLNWYANQHLIVKLELPVSYMWLEVGDYIHFDELIGDKLAFGYDYREHYNKNGQVAYKYFFITSINKNLSNIKIEGVQAHRGEYGFWSSWGTEGDSGGNDGYGDFEIGDWTDDDSYDDDTIIDEEIPEEEAEDSFLETMGWLGDNQQLHWANFLEALIESDIHYENISYGLFVTDNPEAFFYGDAHHGTTDQNWVPQVEANEEPVMAGQWDEPKFLNIQKLSTLGHLSSISIDTDFNIPSQTVPGTTIPWQIVFRLIVFNNISNPYEQPDEEGIEWFPDEYVSLDFVQVWFDESGVTLGDVNGDGIINVLDVVATVNHILSGGTNLEGEALAAADVNQDNIVNVLDVVAIVGFILSGGT